MEGLKVVCLAKSFDGRAVFTGLDMEFQRSEVTAVLGPSGRGKTTLIRVLCGLERQDEGQVLSGCGPDLAVVFQEPRLMPWLTVEGNLSFCLGEKSAQKALASAGELGLEGMGKRYPASLSGGERQRVNLARALAATSDVLLMDEPFNSIGLNMKSWLLPKLKDKLAAEGKTVVLVTHSPVDVALMADRFYLMDAEGAGAEGPFRVELDGKCRRLEDDSTGREVHRLMVLMSSLGRKAGY